jgi:hypothetical protein
MDEIEFLKDQINVLRERQEGLEEMLKSQMDYIKALETTMYDQIINPAGEAVREYERYQGVEGLRGRHPELDALNDKARAIEGDDFDVVGQVYDDYNALPEDGRPTEDEYVGAVIETVSEQIDAIREKLGLPADAEVEIKSDEAGEVEVKADGEDITEEVKEEVVEEPAVEETEDEEIEEDGEEKSDEEELAALYKELGI